MLYDTLALVISVVTCSFRRSGRVSLLTCCGGFLVTTTLALFVCSVKCFVCLVYRLRPEPVDRCVGRIEGMDIRRVVETIIVVLFLSLSLSDCAALGDLVPLVRPCAGKLSGRLVRLSE